MNFFERLRKNVKKNEFVPLNDMFSYGRTRQTVHIHIVPQDLRPLKQEVGQEKFEQILHEKLQDFLCKIQTIAKNDKTINQLFIVSPIFYHDYMKNLFESLEFDEVKEIILDNKDDMAYEQKLKFLNMFNKGHNRTNRVFFTQMSREKLLNQNYEKNRNIREQGRENI